LLDLETQLKVLLLKRGALALAAKGIRAFTLGRSDPAGKSPRGDAEAASRIGDGAALLGEETDCAWLKFCGVLFALFQDACNYGKGGGGGS
jgi:hypothetical protein